MMKANVGGLDRALRVGGGLLLIGLAASGVLGPWAYVGLVPLLTGLTRFCPAYLPFGWSTCAKRR